MIDDSGQFIEKMMELGIGLSMIKQMPDMMDSVMNPSAGGEDTVCPPPLDNPNQFYIAVNNSQAGPFSEEQLKKLIQNNMVSDDTLVWKSGMSSWMPAAQVPEVNKLIILSKLG